MDMITYDLSLPADHPYNLAVVENFGALDDAMFTLMQLFTFDSIGTIYRPLIQQRPLLFFYFMTVLLVLSIALMNLVTAIMVEGALAIAEEDKEVRKTYEQEGWVSGEAMKRLRRKARDALSKGYLDGRLQSALRGFADESEADALDAEPSVPAAPTVTPAQASHASADAKPPLSAEPGVAPAATVSPVQQHSTQADAKPPLSAEPGVAPAVTVSPEVLRPCSPSPAVAPSPEQALQSGQVAPFSARPAASAWVLTDAEGDDTHIETPRLSRFAPSTFRRKPSAHSESSVVSEDLLDFMPDRSSWLLNENKDLQSPAVQASVASRWSHRSLAAEKHALQAMLAEFTPRMSDFIPSSKDLPCKRSSELLHLRPDERPSANDFTLDQAWEAGLAIREFDPEGQRRAASEDGTENEVVRIGCKFGYPSDLLELGEEIGSGAAAKVYVCRRLRTGEELAVKVINLAKLMLMGDYESHLALQPCLSTAGSLSVSSLSLQSGSGSRAALKRRK
ncbi:unnamed protein product, partial [Symbiodinium microadriaticum]